MPALINKQRGVTLVELMIAMLLALMTGAAIMAVFSNSRQNFKQDENTLRMQDDARHAMREIAYDLSMAGHFADLLMPSSVTPDGSLAVATDCGPAGVPDWVYLLRDPGTGENLSLTAVDNATGGAASAAHSCIAGGELVPGTDVVSVKRVAGGASAATSAGQVYLRTNGTVGLLYRDPMGPPAIPVPAPFSEWEYRPRIYYVRNYADSPGDGIPTLCRKFLAAPASMTTECLAVGIENLQIEYGIDTTGNGDANVFLPAPTLAQLQAAVAVRIFLLARTSDPDVQYENDKTYFLSNAPAYSPNDNFHRRVFSMTVGLKNLRSLHQMGT